MPKQPLLLTGYSGIQLFYLSLSQHSQLVHLWLPTHHCAAIMLLTGRHATPLVTNRFFTPAFNVVPHPSVSYRRNFTPILYFQPSSSQSNLRLFLFPPNSYLGKQRISLGGGRHFKHVPLLTCLICLSPKGYYLVGSI